MMKRAALVALLAAGPALAADPTPETIALGQGFYAKNCAACHGVKLEGQPDWKRRLASGRMPAPPHDASGHTWNHSDQELFRFTRDGVAAVVGDGYESDMPAFGGRIGDDDIRAILAYIESTWPAQQRAVQAELTRKGAEVAP